MGKSLFGGVVLAVLITAMAATTAQTNTFGPPLLHADNGQHTMCKNALTANGNAAADHAANRVDSTDMSAYFVGCDGNTDVKFYDFDTGSTTVIAYEQCRSTSGTASGQCQSADVVFNTRLLNGRTTNTWRANGCHEAGHSIGLGHSGESTSCMKTGFFETRDYTGHDRGHINGRY